jgi:hypothetical protein
MWHMGPAAGPLEALAPAILEACCIPRELLSCLFPRTCLMVLGMTPARCAVLRDLLLPAPPERRPGCQAGRLHHRQWLVQLGRAGGREAGSTVRAVPVQRSGVRPAVPRTKQTRRHGGMVLRGSSEGGVWGPLLEYHSSWASGWLSLPTDMVCRAQLHGTAHSSRRKHPPSSFSRHRLPQATPRASSSATPRPPTSTATALSAWRA